MSANEPIIAVFAGGISPERDVSLGSGAACAAALARSFPARLFHIDDESLPTGLDPARHVVFSTLHGTFGEDGGMQRLLDAAGVTYAGCDALSSALTMDKTLTKHAAAARGVKLTSVESTVEGDIDLRGILGLSDEVRNGFQRMRVDFRITGDAEPAKLREIVEQAKARSAVFDVLTNGMPVDITVASTRG